jgi:uncharacterized protein (TIGR00369 family)
MANKVLQKPDLFLKEMAMDAEATKLKVGLVPPETAASMSGLDLLNAMIAGRLPGPPIMQTLDFTLTEVEHGRALFEGHPAFQHYNPLGTVHGGYAATLLDSCMGCAVHTTLPAGVGYTTTDVQLRYIRAMGGATGRVLAEGRVVHAGRRTATAEGRVFTQDDETLIAHGSTGCAILR